jgi:hypothetical protein
MTKLDAPTTMTDHYARAVNASSLVSKPDTTHSATDVLGAHGLAAKRVPLGVALLRLFVGDNHAAGMIVNILADKAVGKAYRLGDEIGRVEAEDMARAVLAWHRDNRCKVCGGHGLKLIPGTTTLGDEPCRPCRGSGRIPFDMNFTLMRLGLARWLAAEIEREQAKAGPAALAALAPRLQL